MDRIGSFGSCSCLDSCMSLECVDGSLKKLVVVLEESVSGSSLEVLERKRKFGRTAGDIYRCSGLHEQASCLVNAGYSERMLHMSSY